MRDIAAALPADRILVETDAPYLAPLPYRGKRNEPAYVVETAKVLAETRGVSLDEIARQTTENFFRLFTKVPRALGERRMTLDVSPSSAAARRWACRASRSAGAIAIRTIRRTAGGAARLLVERAQGPGKVTRVLVDCSPDLREQLLDAEVDWLDGVLITHEHADHTHGIDDLRPLFVHKRRRVDVYLDEPTSRAMHARFGYCFMTPPGSEYPPILTEHRLEPGQAGRHRGAGRPDRGPAGAAGPRRHPLARLPLRQRRLFGRHQEPAGRQASPAMAGLDVWIVDALRKTPHPSHFNLDEALAWIARVKPKRAILTNLHSDLDYAALRASLPADVEPAYDGMTIQVS